MEKIIQITSGRGPAECCWVVSQVLKYLMKEAQQQKIDCKVVTKEKGIENSTLQSVILRLEGKHLDSFLASWVGTVQWVGQSTFRKYHKRKNWYVGVNEIRQTSGFKTFNEQDIRFDFTKSSGPGGQNVNKVNTAVRATHTPSKVSVFMMTHRSQLQNKKEAIQLLSKKVKEKELENLKGRDHNSWQNHNELERGNPIRVFKGSDFKPKHKKEKYRENRKTEKQKLLLE